MSVEFKDNSAEVIEAIRCYNPMRRADIEHIKELLANVWMVDRAAFREIHEYTGIVLSSASEHIPQ